MRAYTYQELQGHGLRIEGFLSGKEKHKEERGDAEARRLLRDLAGAIPYAKDLLEGSYDKKLEHPVVELMDANPEDRRRFGEEITGRKMLTLHVEAIGHPFETPHRFHFKEIEDSDGMFEFAAET